jgi:glucose-6-phosphate 1-epimerase
MCQLAPPLRSGGLPHCWPQFGPGEIQVHGFARNVDW